MPRLTVENAEIMTKPTGNPAKNAIPAIVISSVEADSNGPVIIENQGSIGNPRVRLISPILVRAMAIENREIESRTIENHTGGASASLTATGNTTRIGPMNRGPINTGPNTDAMSISVTNTVVGNGNRRRRVDSTLDLTGRSVGAIPTTSRRNAGNTGNPAIVPTVVGGGRIIPIAQHRVAGEMIALTRSELSRLSN